jgi:hypothetical protein
MQELLTGLRDWSGVLSLLVAGVLYFGRAENKAEDNSQAIMRLEGVIQRLIEKIDKLIDQQADNKATLANHEGRINNLERK